MHLAFVATCYYPRLRGGAEHTLHHHAENLVRRGFRVSVISLHESNQVERFTHNGVECYGFPAPNFRSCLDPKQRPPAASRALWHLVDVYNPVASRLLEKTLREIKPDLVQTETLPGWSCSAWDAARRWGRPHVQMLHDFQLTCPVATRFRNGENCAGTCVSCVPFEALRRRFSQRVSHVVANSAYTRKLHLAEGFFGSAEVFDVIYGAVETPKSVRSPESRGSGPLRVGYIGRLHPTKGIAVLIDSFAALNRKDIVLRIAGSGTKEYEAELRLKAASHAVEFLGHTPAAEFFASIDVLVVPSLWNEPMGRVVIEAANYGIPVIGAARGGIPELILEGRTGWLFDPSVAGALTKQLGELSLGLLQGMCKECIKFGQKFSAEAISDQWVDLYGRMLGREVLGKSASSPSLAGNLVR